MMIASEKPVEIIKNMLGRLLKRYFQDGSFGS
jgi:hypothetical protein